MKCVKCGFDNRSNEKFCPQCGALQDLKEVDINSINTDGLELQTDKEDMEKVGNGKVKGVNKIIFITLLIIITLVAGLFVPDYFANLKAEKILSVTSMAREKITAYASKHQRWPDTAETINFDAQQYTEGKFGLSIKRGVIEVTLAEEPDKVARIMPEVKNGHISWSCDNGGIGPEYLPVGCFR